MLQLLKLLKCCSTSEYRETDIQILLIVNVLEEY